MATTLKTNENRLRRADRLWGVEHFSKAQQAAHEVKVVGGLLYGKDAKTGEYQPLTTTGNVERSLTMKRTVTNRAIFALTPDARFITSLNDVTGTLALGKVYKHSTLTAGGPSAANGEIGVVDGKIKYLSNVSGHYQPNLEVWSQVLDWLEARGVDTSDVKVRVKLFPPEGSDTTVGYEKIDSGEARDVATRLHLGNFKSERKSVEGERILEFAFGSLVLDPGAAGAVRMAHTQAGPIPGGVMAEAKKRGLGEFNAIIVGKKGVTYKFEVPASGFAVITDRFRSKSKQAEIDAREKIPVDLTGLAKNGLALDHHQLTQATALYDLT